MSHLSSQMQLDDEVARSRVWVERQLQQIAARRGRRVETVAWTYRPQEGTYRLVATVNGRRQVLPFTWDELGGFGHVRRQSVERRLLDLLTKGEESGSATLFAPVA